jgi:hypothetical protein
MSKLIAVIVGLVVFLLFIKTVGNPHVIETLLAVILGIITGFFVYFKLLKK